MGLPKLTSPEDCELLAKELLSINDVRPALSLIKKVRYNMYVKPQDALKVVAKLIQNCDRIVANLNHDWAEDYYKCFYIRLHRVVRTDGTIGHDITLNIVLQGQFMAGL